MTFPSDNVQANDDYIKSALNTIYSEVNASVSAAQARFINVSVSDLNDSLWASFVTNQLEIFNAKVELFKSKSPDLYERSLAELNTSLQSEKSTIWALAAFKACSDINEGSELPRCVSEASQICATGNCENSLQSAYEQTVVKKCEVQAEHELHRSTTLINSWWTLDKTAGWLGQSDLMDEISSSFLKSACSIRNSSRAFDFRDQALKNMATVAQHRVISVANLTAVLFVVSILIGLAIAGSHYFFQRRRGLSCVVLKAKVRSWIMCLIRV